VRAPQPPAPSVAVIRMLALQCPSYGKLAKIRGFTRAAPGRTLMQLHVTYSPCAKGPSNHFLRHGNSPKDRFATRVFYWYALRGY
jgi:hypothetical protein